MRLEYSLQAGKTYSGNFKLKNTSDFAVDIFVFTGEYRYLFTKGSIPPESGKKTLPSCKDWIQFKNTKFSLKPGETAQASFLIKIPADIREEHLCAVIFDEKRSLRETFKPRQETGTVQIQVVPRFSIPVYISMKDAEEASAEIKDMTTQVEIQRGGLLFNIIIENTGNMHIRPFGTLIILNEDKEVVKNVPIGKVLPIFPGYKEEIPVPCPRIPDGKYSAIATVEIAKDKIIQKKIMFEFRSRK